MALLLLIAIGAIIGWLATIITRSEDARSVLISVATGSGASIIAGLLANKGSVIGGLSLVALAIALAATVATLGAFHFYQQSKADA